MELSAIEQDIITRLRDGFAVLATPTQCMTMETVPVFHAPPSAYKLHKQLQSLRCGLHIFVTISENDQVKFLKLKRGKYDAGQIKETVPTGTTT